MMQVIECEQGTTEWFACRSGIATASEFATILAKGRDGGASVTRRKYLLRLAGERLTGDVEDTYSNSHFERGKMMEAEARDLYAFMRSAEPQQVGFIRNGDAGCSPDALVGDNGVLEVKTALPSILLDKLLRDDFPPEHKAQCQGGLWIAEREFVDIAVYWPKLPLFIKRAYRDEAYIKSLSIAVDAFNEELTETVERIRHYGDGSAILRQQLVASLGEQDTPRFPDAELLNWAVKTLGEPPRGSDNET